MSVLVAAGAFAIQSGCAPTGPTPAATISDRALLTPGFRAGSVVVDEARGIGPTSEMVTLSGVAGDTQASVEVGASCSGGGGAIVASTGADGVDPRTWDEVTTCVDNAAGVTDLDVSPGEAYEVVVVVLDVAPTTRWSAAVAQPPE